MTDTYTSTVRLQQPTVGADNNTWGGITNTDWQLIDDATNGSVQIDLTGLTSYTMTVNNGTSDQSRNKLYTFVGALSGPCTVTIPASIKHGFVRNATTGDHKIVLTMGSGVTLAVPSVTSTTLMSPFYCDGITGVYDMMFGNCSITDPGYQILPSGLILQWGFAVTPSGGPTPGVAFITPLLPFPNNVFSVTATVQGANYVFPTRVNVVTGPISINQIQVFSVDTATGAYLGPVGFYWMAIGN